MTLRFRHNIRFITQTRTLFGKPVSEMLITELKSWLESDSASLSLNLIEALLNETGFDAGQLFRQDIVSLHDHLKNIRFVLFDVDGVMTDAGMYYTESGDEFKKFNARDGIAIRRLNKAGFITGVISHGINRNLIERRCELLGISKVYAGEEPKINVLKTWCSEMGFELSQTAFIGDDINDLSLISEVGFSACPADAVSAVKSRCDLILETSGGKGAIREWAERCFIHLNN